MQFSLGKLVLASLAELMRMSPFESIINFDSIDKSKCALNTLKMLKIQSNHRSSVLIQDISIKRYRLIFLICLNADLVSERWYDLNAVELIGLWMWSFLIGRMNSGGDGDRKSSTGRPHSFSCIYTETKSHMETPDNVWILFKPILFFVMINCWDQATHIPNVSTTWLMLKMCASLIFWRIWNRWYYNFNIRFTS